MIRTQAGVYELVDEGRNGWNPEAFKERYSDILDKYDYIVGDWGYSQLRLRGFYENTNKKIPFEQKIVALDEYLQEFCNFGCAYFVLKKVRTLGTHPFTQEEQEAVALQEAQAAENVTPESSSRYDRRQNPRFERTKNQRSRQERPDRSNKEQSSGDKTDKNQRQPRQDGKERSDKPFRGERPNKDRRNNSNNRPNRDKVVSDAGSPAGRRFEDKK
ncbi:YutD-like domain-containing protein [Brevibacillus ginsengisoli]|uniref:YutD family protein n=1 Tax=Brevibacillus ginsengisoli TaxID=363854 RepID=UPI003CEC0078